MVAIIAAAFLLTPTGGPLGAQKAGLPDLALLNDARTHTETVTDQQHSFSISTPHDAPLENASIRIEVLEGESINPHLRSSGLMAPGLHAIRVVAEDGNGLTAADSVMVNRKFGSGLWRVRSR